MDPNFRQHANNVGDNDVNLQLENVWKQDPS